MKEQAKKPSIESTLKSLNTEEFIDIHFYRPIGYYWALFFHKLEVSPNAITIASIFIGIAAGICFYFQDLTINILGMLLLIWANSYDSADGQLARMTGQSSPPGAYSGWFLRGSLVYFYLRSDLFPPDTGMGNPDLDISSRNRLFP